MAQLVEFNAMNLKVRCFGEEFLTEYDAYKALLNSGFQFVEDIPEAEFISVFNTDPEPFYSDQGHNRCMFNMYTATSVYIVP